MSTGLKQNDEDLGVISNYIFNTIIFDYISVFTKDSFDDAYLGDIWVDYFEQEYSLRHIDETARITIMEMRTFYSGYMK